MIRYYEQPGLFFAIQFICDVHINITIVFTVAMIPATITGPKTALFCMAYSREIGERSWPSGQGVGLRTLGSWVRSPHRAWFAFEA